MRNRLFLPFLVLILFSQTSCINIIEEIFLNKDGSGKYTFTFDMDELIKEENLSMMRALMAAESDSTAQAATDAMDKMLASDEPIEIDTVYSFADNIDPAESKEYPDFMNRMNMRMFGSSSKEKLKMTFNLDFKNLDELNLIMEAMSEFDPDNRDDFQDSFFGKIKPKQEYYSFKQKKLTRATFPSNWMEAKTDEDKQNMAMLKMFLGSATYKSVVHIPGKATGVSNPKSEISKDKKTITTEIPMLDYMEGKNIVNTIKIK